MPPRPCFDVLEVEAEDVVPLDDVGIALGDDSAALHEQRSLVESVATHDVAEARRVGERDGHDAIALARRVRKLEALGRDDLDVEREPAKIGEPHAAERRAPGQEQVAVSRIAGKERGRGAAALAATVARAERVRPRGEARQPCELAVAFEVIEAQKSRRIAHERGLCREEERRERVTLDDDALVHAAIETHVATVGIELASEKAGRVVPAVDDRRPRFVQPAASWGSCAAGPPPSTTRRYDSRSVRPTTRSPVPATITVGLL